MYDVDGLKRCDRIKVSMMLLVILYHSMALWNRGGWFNTVPANNIVLTYLAGWFNSFHVYVFVFVSGYLYYYLRHECNKYNDIKIFVVKKAKRLLVPYIFVAICWCIPFHVYFYQVSISELFMKYVLAVSPSQLWFLVMLFCITIIMRLCLDKVISAKSKYDLLIIILLFVATIILNNKIPRLFQANAVVKYLPFYMLGMYFRKNKRERLGLPWWGVLLADVIMFGAYDFCVSRNLFTYELLEKTVYLMINLLGIFMVLEVSVRLDKCKFWEGKLYSFFKENNYTLYLFHQQIIFCIITCFIDKVSSVILVLLNFSISLLLSSVLSMILNRFKITRFLIGK